MTSINRYNGYIVCTNRKGVNGSRGCEKEGGAFPWRSQGVYRAFAQLLELALSFRRAQLWRDIKAHVQEGDRRNGASLLLRTQATWTRHAYRELAHACPVPSRAAIPSCRSPCSRALQQGVDPAHIGLREGAHGRLQGQPRQLHPITRLRILAFRAVERV